MFRVGELVGGHRVVAGVLRHGRLLAGLHAPVRARLRLRRDRRSPSSPWGCFCSPGPAATGSPLLMAGSQLVEPARSAQSPLAVNLSLNLLLDPHTSGSMARPSPGRSPWSSAMASTAVLVWRFVGLDPLGSGFLVALGVSVIFAASKFRSTVAVRPDHSEPLRRARHRRARLGRDHLAGSTGVELDAFRSLLGLGAA